MAQTLTLWITTRVRVVFGAAHTTESQYGQSGSQAAELAVWALDIWVMAFHHLILLLRYLFSPLCLAGLGASLKPTG